MQVRERPGGAEPTEETLVERGRLARFREWFGPEQLVLVCAVLYGVSIAFLAVYKHEVFASSRFDLGNMDQAVWNSAHGRILEATDEVGEITSRLKNHADLLLLLYVPLYWIFPTPYWLLISQAVVVGAGAIPLYWLARRFLKRGWPAAFIAVAYLLNPGLQAANLFDYHAQMMAGTFLLFAFHYVLERRLWPFLIFAVLATLTKEGISLVVAMMGVYMILIERRPRWGVLTFIGGVGVFLLTMLVLIPAFNTEASSGLVEERYVAFGGSMSGVVKTALTDPFFVLSYMFTPARWTYFAQLFGMSGFLGLLAPHLLVIPASELAINLLSDRPQMTNTYYHYSAAILPFTYVAAAAGLANLMRILRLKRLSALHILSIAPLASSRVPLVLAFCIMLFGAQMVFLAGPLPFFHAPSNYRSVIDPSPAAHREALREAIALVPDDAKVSATNNIGPHLAHRRYLYLFPTVLDADYVVLDESAPGYDTQIEPVLSLQSTQELKRSGEFVEVFSKEGVEVFRRVGESG
ncbi:MAG: DUF2079 domain-containing protein [Rubrobacter sp.]